MDKLDVYTKKVDDWMAKYPTITGYGESSHVKMTNIKHTIKSLKRMMGLRERCRYSKLNYFITWKLRRKLFI